MINLIFSFVFTTAKTNLFYALQKAAAIKSANISAVRYLESFLGQTLHFIDKLSLRLGRGTPEVPVMSEGLVLHGSTFFPSLGQWWVSRAGILGLCSLSTPSPFPLVQTHAVRGLASAAPSATSLVGSRLLLHLSWLPRL